MLITIFLLLTEALFARQRIAPCVITSDTVGLESPVKPPEVRVLSWRTTQKDLQLVPELFLSPEFMEQLRFLYKEIVPKVEKLNLKDLPEVARVARNVFSVQIFAGEELVVGFHLAEAKSDSTVFGIENLKFNDPTKPMRTLASTQVHPGFSLDQYHYAMNGISKLVRAAGGKKILIPGASSYLVSLLYIRTLHADYSSKNVENTFGSLQEMYRTLRKSEDPMFRVDSLSEFSDILGKNWTTTRDSENNELTQEEVLKIGQTLATGQIPDSYKIYSSNNATWGVLTIANDQQNDVPRKVLIEKKNQKWIPVNWYSLYSQNRTTLAIDLAPNN